ncbi:MAG: hypothetical protein RL594_1202 [Bacteroidota bacterium]|jgi:hypothetical protein
MRLPPTSALLQLLTAITLIMIGSAPLIAQVPFGTIELRLQKVGNTQSINISTAPVSSSFSLVLPGQQGASGSVLTNDGSGNLSWTSMLSSIGSSGTTHYLPVFTSASTVGNSLLYQDGSNIGVGTISPGARLQVDIPSSSGKGLIIRAATGATANLVECQNSSGSALFQVSSNGDLSRIRNVSYSWPTAAPSPAASATQLGEGVLTSNASGTLLWKQLISASATLDFPITATRTSSDLTITVTGVTSGDMVALGVPNTAVLANSCYTAWVSADDVVTVRFNNFDNAEKNPVSGTFKVTVIK